MKTNIRKYDTLTKLFIYPHADILTEINEVKEVVEEFHPEMVETLNPFIDCVRESTRSEMEEIYTRTFDVQAVTTLDIGYVLFGDDYKRGELLANLNREHLSARNDCGTELADHFPNILKLLPRMADEVIRLELVVNIVLPALNKILNDFSSDRIDKKNVSYKKHHKTIIENSKKYSLIYLYPLQLVFNILKKDYNVKFEINGTSQNDFTTEIITELEINTKQL